MELDSEHEGPVCPLATFMIAGYLGRVGGRGSGLQVQFVSTLGTARPQLLPCLNRKVILWGIPFLTLQSFFK
jgi:hypothetical protein